MWISRFRVQNFKSFSDSGSIDLSPGFNVITGKNNSGKSALLSAMAMGDKFQFSPHRSLASAPSADTQVSQESKIEFDLRITGNELRRMLENPNDSFSIPLPTPTGEMRNFVGFTGDEIERIPDYIFQQAELTFRGGYIKSSNGDKYQILNWPSFTLYPAQGSLEEARLILVSYDPSGNRQKPSRHNAGASNEFAYQQVFPRARQMIFLFSAERMNVGIAPFGTSLSLLPNAVNLPEVLNSLQGQHIRFRRYVETVSAILPQVRDISIRPISENRVEILIWPVDPATERADLAVPLLESGTGISQVLAIIYVAITADNPQIILIDEPQSFLHPGAVRKLMEILGDFKDHQFIISTHSPVAIAAANPQKILMIEQNDGISTVSNIDATRTEELTKLLAEIGASLSDVFGADDIVWCEGATEEICFPMILHEMGGVHLRGTKIKGVVNTGDFIGRHSELIIEIYERLSGGPSLLPPALAFLFDDEGRSNQEKNKLIARTGELVKFIPRRNFESFLLNPGAIQSLIDSIEGFRDTEVLVEEISAWIDSKKNDPKYGVASDDLMDWEYYVDGALILQDLFSDLSENRATYRKVEHGPILVRWIIDNDPKFLDELVEFLRSVIATGRD